MENKIVEIKYRSYFGKKYILTKAETEFYEVLKGVIGEKNIIFCKVRMEDLVGAKNNRYKEANRNRIKSRHADFAIFNKETMTIRLVIELDGSSHNNAKSLEIDKFKNEVYGSAGIKIARVIQKPYYDSRELAEQIKEAYNTEYKIIYHEKDSDLFDLIIKKIIELIKSFFK
jgi:very-short-patch-repair endonuclease